MKPLRYVSGKIPCLKSTSASVSSSVLTVTFPAYSGIPKNYTGLIVLNIPQYVGGLTFTSVVFTTQGSTETQDLITQNNTAVTQTDLIGNGIYLAFYDKDTDVLQLL